MTTNILLILKTMKVSGIYWYLCGVVLWWIQEITVWEKVHRVDKLDVYGVFTDQYCSPNEVCNHSTIMACTQYSGTELNMIKLGMVKNSHFKQLKNDVIIKIRKLHLNKRGKRGGRKNRVGVRMAKLKNRSVNMANNIKIQMANDHISQHRIMLQLSTINCQSVKSKEDQIIQHILDNNIDLVVLTETWLKETDRDRLWLQACSFNKDNYSIAAVNRCERPGGGIALVYSRAVQVKMEKSGQKRSFEYVIWKVMLKGGSITLIGIHHAPYSSTNRVTESMFIDDFTEWLAEVIPVFNNLCITGDFNIHVNNLEDENACIFNDTLEAFGLVQHVKFSTHKAGNTLDLIITELSSQIGVSRCAPGMYFSDHCSVDCVTNIERPTIQMKKVKYRKLRDIDVDQLVHIFQHESLHNTDDLDELVDLFESRLETSLDKQAPEKCKQISVRSVINSWFTKDILEQKQKIRSLERKWNRYELDSIWEEIKKERRAYKYMIRTEKRRVIQEKVLECGNDAKKLYGLINYLIGNVQENPLPEHSSDEQLANSFADFFIEKIEKIRRDLCNHEIYAPSADRDVPSMCSFVPMTSTEVMKLAGILATKSCELDKWPTQIFKKALPHIIEIVTHIINLSLEKGVFVRQWKQAFIRPLLKKQGLAPVLSNFRPVSNLTFLGKLLEKCALYQLNSHCNGNNLLPQYQSAYRENFSCETALVKLMDDILWSMEQGKVTTLVATDLSAAFDTVDYDVTNRVLEMKFGLKDTVLSWVESYLLSRTCKVNVGQSYSTERKLKCGVPQGSCMGPYLYLMYASTLREVIPESIQLHGYADDHAFQDRLCSII